MKRLLSLTLLLLALPVQAEVYKCVDGGKVVYADAPCKPDAKPITLKPGLAPEPVAYSNWNAVRDVRVGMTEDQVVKLCGRPTRSNSREYRSVHHEQWQYGFYPGIYGYVYLENGIVTSTSY